MTKVASAKYDKILQASLTLFTGRGFHNTPTSLIAREAGVATGTLFHHFKNKEELINSLYLEVKTKLVTALKDKFIAGESIEEKLKAAWINGVQWGIMHPKEFQFLMQFANSPFITHLTREQAMSQYEAISDLFEQAMQEGVIKSSYPEFVADYFEGVFNLGVSHFRKHPENISEENLEKAFDICWDGIAAR